MISMGHLLLTLTTTTIQLLTFTRAMARDQTTSSSSKWMETECQQGRDVIEVHITILEKE